jgi:ketosteroid isomerase-like protein
MNAPRIPDLLDGTGAAHLAVAGGGADDAPSLSPAWVGRDGDRVVVAVAGPVTADGGSPDGRAVSLSVDGPAGERVVVRGRAVVTDGPAAAATVDALAHKYLGASRPGSATPLTVLAIDVASAEVVAGEPAGVAGPDPAATRRVVVDMLDALARGDRVAARAAFAVDATWQCPPSMPWPPTYQGRDAIFDEYFAVDVELFETGVSVYDLEVLNTVAEGDQVAVEMRHRSVGVNGEPYETDHSLVYVVRDGVITAVREYIDTLYLTRALLG